MGIAALGGCGGPDLRETVEQAAGKLEDGKAWAADVPPADALEARAAYVSALRAVTGDLESRHQYFGYFAASDWGLVGQRIAEATGGKVTAHPACAGGRSWRCQLVVRGDDAVLIATGPANARPVIQLWIGLLRRQGGSWRMVER